MKNMCIICRNEVLAFGDTGEYKNKRDLEVLDCHGCTAVTSIPNIHGLRLLSCRYTSLTFIPNIQGLISLYCDDCTSLTSIPNIQELIILSCDGCTSLISIPNIQNLISLSCDDCTSLTSIPNIQGLENLSCNRCTSLTSIPNIQGLENLSCDGCILLTSIPDTQEFSCKNCPWLNHPKNPDFKKNINLLIQLHQKLRWRQVRMYLESTRFNEWFYSPNNLGGKMMIQKLYLSASNRNEFK